MNTVDRVMRAYCLTHKLNEAQAAFVRVELERFIDQLIAEGPIAARADVRNSAAVTTPKPSARVAEKTPETGTRSTRERQ